MNKKMEDWNLLDNSKIISEIKISSILEHQSSPVFTEGHWSFCPKRIKECMNMQLFISNFYWWLTDGKQTMHECSKNWSSCRPCIQGSQLEYAVPNNSSTKLENNSPQQNNKNPRRLHPQNQVFLWHVRPDTTKPLRQYCSSLGVCRTLTIILPLFLLWIFSFWQKRKIDIGYCTLLW